MANLKKDIIFGSVFTAAPEQIVNTNTAFKKMQATTTEAGIKKISPNTQVGNIVNGLKTVGVWDAETLTELTQATGNDGAKAIAAIASFIISTVSMCSGSVTQMNMPPSTLVQEMPLSRGMYFARHSSMQVPRSR